MQKIWYVYIIQTVSGKLYTGITTDTERRFNEHLSGKGGAKFFRSDPAHKMVYVEKMKNRSLASKREAAIKCLSRIKKMELISKF